METNQLLYEYYETQRLIGRETDHLRKERNTDNRQTCAMIITRLEADKARYAADLEARGICPYLCERYYWHLMTGAKITQYKTPDEILGYIRRAG